MNDEEQYDKYRTSAANDDIKTSTTIAHQPPRVKREPHGKIRRLPYRAALSKVFKAFPKYFGLYLGLVGLFSFNCFILEEAFQTVMFGSWGAFNAKEYTLIKREIATQEKLRTTLQVINNVGGWLNPFGWFAYQGYVDAEREWIEATKAKLFSEAPEQFCGEVVTFTFTPLEEEPTQADYSLYRNGKVVVMAKHLDPVVTGRVQSTIKDGVVIIDAR